jgi:hypothetical protein
VGHAPDYRSGVNHLGCWARVVGAVDDELNVFKVDGLILGELDTKQADVVGSDGGFT